MLSIEEQLNLYEEIMIDFYEELASSIYGPNWWVKPGLNLYLDLTTNQRVRFARLVISITKKNGSTPTLVNLWRFIDIVCNDSYMRLIDKLKVIFRMLPRLLIMTGILGLILYGLSQFLLFMS